MSYTSTSTSERTMPSRPKRKVTGLEEAFPDQPRSNISKKKEKEISNLFNRVAALDGTSVALAGWGGGGGGGSSLHLECQIGCY